MDPKMFLFNGFFNMPDFGNLVAHPQVPRRNSEKNDRSTMVIT